MESCGSKTSHHLMDVKFHHGSCSRKLFVCLPFQGKFILTFDYGNHKYGLSRDTVEGIARDGLASCVHMEMEVRTFRALSVMSHVCLSVCVYLGLGRGLQCSGSTLLGPRGKYAKVGNFKFAVRWGEARYK